YHPANIHGGVLPKQESGRVHEKEVGVSETSGLNGPEDVRDIPPRDATQDVGCGQAGVIEKVRDVVVGNIEVPEAMEQVHATPWPGSTRDIVLDRSGSRSRREIDLRVQSRGCDG